LAPGSTPVPTQTVTVDVGGSGKPVVIGDISQVPPAQSNGSVVLFSNGNVTVTMSTTFTNTTLILKDAVIKSASISFKINYLSSPVDLAIILRDEEGNYGGNATQNFGKPGDAKIDITQLYADLLKEYKQSFTLARAIRGNILKVSIGIVTENVAIEVDPASVKSNVEFTVAVTQAPQLTTLTPTSTKMVLGSASSLYYSMAYIFVLATLLCL
jgi:hypothetical protein